MDYIVENVTKSCYCYTDEPENTACNILNKNLTILSECVTNLLLKLSIGFILQSKLKLLLSVNQ